MDNPNTPNPVNRNQQQGTGFTNLSRIIGANRNNGLSKAVGGGLQNQANQVKTGIQSSSNQFQQEAQKQNFATDENKQKVQTIINDPTKATDSDVDQFSTFRSGRYDGPTELGNKQTLQNQTTQAQTLGSMAGSQAGRQGLLQRFVGGTNYGQGKQRLDTAILGQTGGNQIQVAARDTRGLGQQLNQADAAAQQQAGLIANQNKQFADQTKTALNTGLEGIQSGAENAMNQFINTRDNLLTSIKKDAAFDASNPTGGPKLTSEEYNALVDAGFDPKSYLYNLNAGDYLQKSDFIPTLSSALDSNQAARAQALVRLSGNDISQRGQVLATAAADSANIGTLQGQKALKFNQDQFKQAQGDTQEAMLRDYFSSYVAPNAGPGRWDVTTADQFLDNIKNKGILYGRVNGDEGVGAPGGYGSLSNMENATFGTANMNAYHNLGMNDYGNGNNYTDTAAKVASIYNTGGDYASKSNIEKAIDALRAGNAAYDAQGDIAKDYYWSGEGPMQTLDTSLRANVPGMTSTLPGFLTGGGFNSYADKYGRLRQLLSPTPAAQQGLVGDNSANAALKAEIAKATGGQ